jgi:hypothetical protein
VPVGRLCRAFSLHPSGFSAQLMADIRALMLEMGIPFLERLASAEDIARRLAGEPDHRNDPHTADALAYSLILTVGRRRREAAPFDLGPDLRRQIGWEATAIWSASPRSEAALHLPASPPTRLPSRE